MLKTEDGDELYLDLDDEVFRCELYLFLKKLMTTYGHSQFQTLDEYNMQIRFSVSSIKYPSIPVEQQEDDPPFAPMQIVVSFIPM
jgi:DNA-directed RNA polymerase III subunit RPC8